MDTLMYKKLLDDTVKIVDDDKTVTTVPGTSFDDTLKVTNDLPPVDDNSNGTLVVINNVDKSAIEELEDDIQEAVSVDDDVVTESVCKIVRNLRNLNAILENGAAKIKAVEYTILTETVSDPVERDVRLTSLLESANDSMWSKFIDWLSRSIKWIKEKCMNMYITAMAKFDIYGKYAVKYEDILKKNAKKISKSEYNITCKMHDWNTDALYNNMTDFSNIHNLASTIIGKATDKNGMKKKLDDYENGKWQDNEIYSYLMTKITGININSKLATEKSAAINKLADKVMGDIKELKIGKKDINIYIERLKSIKPNLTRISVNAKKSLINPEFDALLADAKKEQNKHSDNQDGVVFRYYRTRYKVLSIAQEVALDLYKVKMGLIKTYAHETYNVLKMYLDKTTSLTESVDYISMNTDVSNMYTLSE